jgi:glutamate racemase
MKPASVLIFDSGMGGISILRKVRKLCPGIRLIYCSDFAGFPYGTRKEDNLIQRVDDVLGQAVDRFKPDIVIIACNTASTVALPHLRNRFSMPMIGVVPAIKPAAQMTLKPVIGLLATPATIERTYTHDLIREFGSPENNHQLKWKCVGSSRLVELAETFMLNGKLKTDEVRQTVEELATIPEQDIDTIVLACTHFPLIQPALSATLPHIQHWVDSGNAIARRVAFWIKELGLDANPENPQANSIAVFTGRKDQWPAKELLDKDNLVPTENLVI